MVAERVNLTYEYDNGPIANNNWGIDRSKVWNYYIKPREKKNTVFSLKD